MTKIAITPKGRAGQGRAGQGSAGQGRAGHGRAGQGSRVRGQLDNASHSTAWGGDTDRPWQLSSPSWEPERGGMGEGESEGKNLVWV